MDKNFRDALDEEIQTGDFEVSDIEVKRLHDDSSEIIAGQQVAFVATFKLRIKNRSSSLAMSLGMQKGDVLLELSSSTELQSEWPVLSTPERKAAWQQWLAANYDFRWSVNGESVRTGESGQRRPPRTGAPLLDRPWLLVLETVALDSGYVDVRVDIPPRAAPPKPPLKPPAEAPASSPSSTRIQLEDSPLDRMVVLELQGARQSPVSLESLPEVIEACLQGLLADVPEGQQGELVLSLAWHPSRPAKKG